MTPNQLAKSGTEEAHQRAAFAYFAVATLHGFTVADLWASGEVAADRLPAFCVDTDQPAIPELHLLFHIPNGGARGDDAKTRMIRGGAMKAAGVKPGVSDLFLAVARGQFHGLFIEMKKPALKKKDKPLNGVSEDQAIWFSRVTRQGYACACCYTWEEVVAVVKRYICMTGNQSNFPN